MNNLNSILPSKVVPNVLISMRTGSSYICNPPVEDTDVDYVLLVDNIQGIGAALLAEGWRNCLDDAKDACTLPKDSKHSPRLIVRKDEYNLIIVDSSESFNIWRISTDLAKRFNLLVKEDRVDLFSAIRDRYLASEED